VRTSHVLLLGTAARAHSCGERRLHTAGGRMEEAADVVDMVDMVDMVDVVDVVAARAW